MDPNAKKKLIGAIIAAAVAIAVYYGVIDQKQADSIRTQADQTLGTGPAAQQTPQAPQPAPAPQTSTAPQTTTTQAAPPPQTTTAPAPPATQPAMPPSGR